jgi:hypothetical protein
MASAQSLLELDDDDSTTNPMGLNAMVNALLHKDMPVNVRYPTRYRSHHKQYPEMTVDDYQKVYLHPIRPLQSDHVQLAKRIIMLPRVGRRSLNRK